MSSLFFFLLSLTLILADPCSFPYNDFANYSTAVSCLLSIPFSESIRSATLVTLRKAYPLNVFGDIIKNSGAPYNINVDILASLSTFETSTYANDFSFHQALSALYASPHDGHTWYRKPACYDVSFLQPFDLYSFVSGGTQKIGIVGINSRLGDRDVLRSAFQSVYGFDPSIYVGWEIETIDGVTALTAIKNYASANVGTSRDEEVRFNIALNTQAYEPFVARRTPYLGIPSSETLSLGLRNGQQTQTINSPWIVYNFGNFNDSASFQSLCAPQQTKRSVQKSIPKRMKNELPSTTDPKILRKILKENLQEIISVDSVGLYRFDQSTAVLQLRSFGDPDMRSFMELNITRAFTTLGFTKLIIDTRGNGGGIVCNAANAARWLSADIDDIALDYAYDEKYNSYINAQNTFGQEYQIGGFDSLSYLDLEGDPYQNFNFYTNGPSYTRGGSSSKYSYKFLYPCSDSGPFAVTMARLGSLNPGNIIVLTDGSCGSSCETWLRAIQDYNAAKVVGIGGYYGTTTLESGSFPGGVSESLQDELDYTEYFDSIGNFSTDPRWSQYMMVPMPTSANNGWPLFEIYNNFSDTIPRDFTSAKTDWKIDYWNFTNTQEIYTRVSAYFTQCPNWGPSCSCTNGQITCSDETSAAVIVQAAVFLIAFLVFIL